VQQCVHGRAAAAVSAIIRALAFLAGGERTSYSSRGSLAVVSFSEGLGWAPRLGAMGCVVSTLLRRKKND